METNLNELDKWIDELIAESSLTDGLREKVETQDSKMKIMGKNFQKVSVIVLLSSSSYENKAKITSCKLKMKT